ncbi:hypothetical protein BN1723_016629 [Verticillium longisporum]|nr:hypothetical protein BN1723_016629 [Verticillium longisporum]
MCYGLLRHCLSSILRRQRTKPGILTSHIRQARSLM